MIVKLSHFYRATPSPEFLKLCIVHKMTTLSTLSLDVLRLVVVEFLERNKSLRNKSIIDKLVQIPFPRLKELVKFYDVKFLMSRPSFILRKYMRNMKPHVYRNLERVPKNPSYYDFSKFA